MGMPLPPPAKSGSGLTILFIVLGVMAFLGMMGIGAVWYGWHMVKQKAASNGVDLNAFTETQHGPARRLDACALLTKDDLSQILSLAIDRSEGTGRSTSSTCRYYSAQAQQRGSDQAADAFKKLQAASQSGNTSAEQEEAIKNINTMVRGMASSATSAGNGATLSIEVVTDNAKAAMAGFKLGMGVVGAMAGAGNKDVDPKMRKVLYEEVSGVADEAAFGPMQTMFMFRKGDVAVTLDARGLPGGKDAELAIAKRIVSRL